MRGYGSLKAWVREPACVDARVREVADQTVPVVTISRYHFAGYRVPFTYP